MPVVRGFVQKIDVGRAGLVQVTLVHEDASNAVYVIRDIDADPERFNERLSKLGVLRDAMTRAEPVEIEHEPREGANEIARAARITRDSLRPAQQIDAIVGLVVLVAVTTSQGIAANGTERADEATVTVLTMGEGLRQCILDLQAPERLVATEQLRMLLDAEAHTRAVALVVETISGGPPRILGVTVEDADVLGSQGLGQDISGFVESLSLIQVAGAGPTATTFAHSRFTTAPNFTGPGNTIANSPFVPTTLDLLVPKNSLTYALFEAGLRDNLRMRVRAQAPGRKDGDDGRHEPVTEPGPQGAGSAPGVRINVKQGLAGTEKTPEYLLALAAELLAPLASASRPVWINIERESLDRGVESGCAEGVPSSDLSLKSLRDLKIPYAAVWKGLGCFNHGVYRIQIEADSPLTVKLDCEKLCLHDSGTPHVKLAYACIGGDHVLEIELSEWTCDQTFNLDVYRIR